MFILFIDTECLYGTKLRIDNYRELIEYQNQKVITMIIHDFVIKELKNRIFRDLLQIQKDASQQERQLKYYWGVEISLAPTEEHLLSQTHKAVDTFCAALGAAKIEYAPELSIKTFDDYFSHKNTFEHIKLDKAARERVKRNVIDSIIAHAYVAEFKKLGGATHSSHLVTKNKDDFTWMEPEGIKTISSIKTYLEQHGSFLTSQVNSKIQVEILEKILTTISKQANIEKLKELVSDKVSEMEEIARIQGVNYEWRSYENVTIMAPSDGEKIKIDIKDPIVTLENGEYSVLFPLNMEYVGLADYAADCKPMLDEEAICFDENLMFDITAKYKDLIDVYDESGMEDGIVAIMQESTIKVSGHLKCGPVDAASFDFDNLISKNPVLTIVDTECEAFPIAPTP